MPKLERLASIVVVGAALFGATGCVAYSRGTARETTYDDLRREDGWLLVDVAPIVRQESDDDCGAASLSTVLAVWGVDASAETLRKECAVADESGLRATSLRDAARRRGLSAFLLAGRVADLDHELRRGRPVLVGVVKSAGTVSVTHFEVVVGLHPGAARVAALDPARGLVCDALADFAGEWAATKGVTLVVFRPESKATTAATGGL
jgi:ABC-type bacteriocin/lantibiotic exporter with double-glycine peptidase domain